MNEPIVSPKADDPSPGERKASSSKKRKHSGVPKDFACVKRKRHHRGPPAQNFLFGGNAKDPLNLGSIPSDAPLDEDDNGNDKRDQIPRPVHIHISSNTTGHKRHKRKRRRHESGKEHPSGCFSDSELTGSGAPPKLLSPDVSSSTKKRKKFQSPSPSDTSKPDPETCSASGVPSPKITQTSQNKKNKDRFRYGNYNKYYGKRMENERDPRLKLLKREWFENKLVLDIGCNVGYITTSIAQLYNPKLIVGTDIDPSLIGKARSSVLRARVPSNTHSKYPPSFSKSYGPLTAPIPPAEPDDPKSDLKFPKNVAFQQGNYVLECDDLLSGTREEYDVIMALSVSKWVHLNWGDAGLKRFFTRAFLNLKPGGLFILEPQALATYKKRSKLTEDMLNNFREIRFEPDHFVEYLLKEVGYASYSSAGTPSHKAKGFERPILVFHKNDANSIGQT